MAGGKGGDIGQAPDGGASCVEMGARWAAVVSTATVTACTVDDDCIVVGGTDSCGCAASLGGCGKAVNRAAYDASEARAIEVPFSRDCKQAFGTCDCGHLSAGCRSAKCVITSHGCCFPCSSDAG
jgi:hypothetical protein